MTGVNPRRTLSGLVRLLDSGVGLLHKLTLSGARRLTIDRRLAMLDLSLEPLNKE